jgi:molybdate transport system ATP-binding protein
MARDIILATESPNALSVRNVLEGTIADMSEDDQEAVLVKVDIGGATVLSRITQNACEALKLQQGSAVWVLVKAVSTRGHAFTLG